MISRRKLAAIVFADIVGYTAQVSADETRGLEHRREFEALARTVAASGAGRVVKMIGDAAMLEFASAVEAVSCALELQARMADLDARLGAGGQLRVRVGVHVGDVAEEGGDLFGNAVNIAQRVHDLAQPGGICITRDVYVQIRPIMKLRCEPARRRGGKPMPEPVEVFAVLADGPGTYAGRGRSWPGRLSGMTRRARLVAVAGAVASIHLAFALFAVVRAGNALVAPTRVVVGADGMIPLVGRGFSAVRVLLEVGAGGPVAVVSSVPVRAADRERLVANQAIMSDEAADLVRRLGAQTEAVAVRTETWMRSAQITVILRPRCPLAYLEPLLPARRIAPAVLPRHDLTKEAERERSEGSAAPAQLSSDARSAPTPFAVVGGRYVRGDDLPIGGRQLGAWGLAFLGGLRMEVRQWTPDGVIAVVPMRAAPGEQPVIVVPEEGNEIEAGTVTITGRAAGSP